MASVRQGDWRLRQVEEPAQRTAASAAALGGSTPGALPGFPDVRRSGASWMVTFTDLVALLLTFFVMVFAMRDVEENTWQTITNSFVTALDTMDETNVAAPVFDIDIKKVSKPEGQDVDYLRAVIENLLRDSDTPPIARIEVQGRAVAIRTARGDLLRPDGATLSDSGEAYVFHLAGVLGNLPNAVKLVVQVQGGPAAEPQVGDWAEALHIGGLVAGALARRGYAAPIEVRAASSGNVAAGAGRSEASVDVLILPDART